MSSLPVTALPRTGVAGPWRVPAVSDRGPSPRCLPSWAWRAALISPAPRGCRPTCGSSLGRRPRAGVLPQLAALLTPSLGPRCLPLPLRIPRIPPGPLSGSSLVTPTPHESPRPRTLTLLPHGSWQTGLPWGGLLGAPPDGESGGLQATLPGPAWGSKQGLHYMALPGLPLPGPTRRLGRGGRGGLLGRGNGPS